MRVDELEIGEIYRVLQEDRRFIPVVVDAQYEGDKFIKFGHTTLPTGPTFHDDNEPVALSDHEIMEPLVYIGTKPSRMYTHEAVEATHVFASPTGEKYCVQGRMIKYILPFTP